MKIALINTFDRLWGSSIACSRLAEALREAGAQPRMVVQEAVGDASRLDVVARTVWQKKIAKARLAAEKLDIYRNDQNKGWNFAFGLGSTGLDISRRPSIADADLLHLHWINNGFLSLASVEKLAALGKPLVWTMHDMWPFTGGCFHSYACERYRDSCGKCPALKGKKENDLSRKVWRRKMQLFEGWENRKTQTAFISPSAWLADKARESSLLKDFRVEVIPNAINTKLFYPTDRRAARERYKLPQDENLVLFGSFNFNDPNKGFVFLRDALLKLKAAGQLPPTSVVAFGKPTELPKVEGIPIRYVGLLKTDAELRDCYSACDVAAIPSLAESFSLVTLEALACATPVLAFGVGGIPDMIDHRANGWIADYKSSDSLAEGLIYLLDGGAPAEQLRERAVAKVEAEFSYPAVARKHLNLYQDLLRHGK